MDKKLKTKWLKALRSGKYAQGDSFLKLRDGKVTKYCCLGVLCEVGRIRSSSDALIRGRDGAPRILPNEVQNELASMNDSGKRFSTIAKWIEKNL